MATVKTDNWKGTTYGNGWMHRWLIRFLRVTDVRLLYLFASVFVVPTTMAVNAPGRRAMLSFFRERMGMGRWRALWNTYRNHCAFSQVVIDRFAMYAGKRFSITIDGFEHFQQLSAQPEGFVQLSSHIGNYEISGYSLHSTKRVNALVFGGEKGSVMANRSRLFEGNNIRMIPVTTDMSHLFQVDQALSNGEIVSMPADRVFGSQKAFEVELLGAPARLPQGPFLLAAVRGVSMLYVSVMKSGLRSYHITCSRIAPPPSGTSRAKAQQLAESYASLLEATVRRHPRQWYNYFDFWAQ